MNRINCFASVRGFALAIAIAAFGGGVGCAGQTDQSDVQGTDSRHSHMVGGGNDNGSLDGDGVNIEHSLDTSHSPIHPQTGTNLGPRPEPWNSDEGDSNGPRPEPWHKTNSDDVPPDDTTPTGNGTSSSSGGTGGTSSGGNPGNPSTK